MALKGDTGNFQLADIFQTLAQGGQTGLLTLSSESTERRILFSSHGVTAADAAVFRAPKLGHLLVAGGLVEQGQVETALQELDREGPNPLSAIPLLVVLEEKGLLRLHDGVHVLRTQVREELFEVFQLPEMDFEFLEDDSPVEGIPRECYFRVEEVVMEAARRMDEWTRMDGHVDTAEYYVLPERGKGGDQQSKDDHGAAAVVELLDGSHTIQDIAEKLLRPRFDITRAVFSLIVDARVRISTADELIRSARSLDPRGDRQRVTRLCQRALKRVGEEDARLDDIADLLVLAGATQAAVAVLSARARMLLKSGNPETAYTQIVRARDMDPNSLRVQQVLAELHRARGETASEIKVLTTLAERSAAEDRFGDAVEYAARVGELNPDAPILDQAFVLYCQKAERHEFGAEVLSAAAGKRTNATNAAILYSGILLLDPSRSDIKKALARQHKTRTRSRSVWIAAAAMIIPVGFIGIHMASGRVEQARLIGRVDSAEELLNSGEVRLASAQLRDVSTDSADDELKERIERLRGRAETKLAELDKKAETERSRQSADILATIQVCIDGGDWRRAFLDIGSAIAAGPDKELRAKIDTRLKLLADAIEADSASIQRATANMQVPHHERDLPAFLAKLGDVCSPEALKKYTEVQSVLGAAESGAAEIDRMTRAVSGAIQAIGEAGPALEDARSRLARAKELDTLSFEFESVQAAEERGDYRAARDGYARVLREYGKGTLTAYFEEKLAFCSELCDLLSAAEARLKDGDVEGAATLIKDKAVTTKDVDLLTTMGVPVRVSTLPRGAEVQINARTVGLAPQDFFVRRGTPLSITVASPGFISETFEVTYDGAADRHLALLRAGRYSIDLGARAEADPIANDGAAFIASRDGVLRRLELGAGNVSHLLDTGSLGGLVVRPSFVSGEVIVVTAEGTVIGASGDNLRERWRHAYDGTPLPHSAVASSAVIVAFRDGRIFEISADGRERPITKLSDTLVAGVSLCGDVIAVGTGDGRIIGVSRSDGHTVFRTPAGGQPVSGITTDGRTLFAALDSGVLVALEASKGTEVWRHTADAAFAAGPKATDGKVVYAAGRTAIVLDATNGASRMEVTVNAWIGGAPTLSGGRLYVGDRDGDLSVFDFQAHDLLFRHRMGAALKATPLALSDGILLIDAEGGVSLIGS